MNNVCIVGNLTRDIELVYLDSGVAKATFTVAVNRVWRDKEGNKKEEVNFIPVVIWGAPAENCNSCLCKGSKVSVEGRINVYQYEDDSGSKRTFTSVVAYRVGFLNSRSDDQQQQQQPAPQQQRQQQQPQYQQQSPQQQPVPQQQQPQQRQQQAGPSEVPL